VHGEDAEGPQQGRRRVREGLEGWKSYLADPAPGNALIKKDNPNMTDDQLAYSVAKLKEMGMITGGDAAKLGIGMMTDAARQGELRLPRDNKLLDPAKVNLAKTYNFEFVKDAKVMP
jgi:NitT/TauT family transport system substrate-binding protein